MERPAASWESPVILDTDEVAWISNPGAEPQIRDFEYNRPCFF